MRLATSIVGLTLWSGSAFAVDQEFRAYVEATSRHSTYQSTPLFADPASGDVGARTEASLFSKTRWDNGTTAVADVSGFYKVQQPIGDGDTPAGFDKQDSWVLVRELYVDRDVSPTLNAVAGKRRVLWGPGVLLNPTDLLTSGKDVTGLEPSVDGAWMTRLESVQDSWTVTGIYSPQTRDSDRGLPTDWREFRADGSSESHIHDLLALRTYVLAAEVDWNLIWYRSNRYRDDVPTKDRFGLSASRYVLDDWELHFEGLTQKGSARDYWPARCPGGGLPCPREVAGPTRDTTRYYARWIAGTRVTFRDDAFMSLELYHQDDGLAPNEFGQLLDLFDLRRRMGGEATDTASPSGARESRLSLLCRDYLSLGYYHKELTQDLWWSASLLHNVAQGAGVVSTQLSWDRWESLQFTLGAFSLYDGMPAAGETHKHSESDLSPESQRLVVTARLMI